MERSVGAHVDRGCRSWPGCGGRRWRRRLRRALRGPLLRGRGWGRAAWRAGAAGGAGPCGRPVTSVARLGGELIAWLARSIPTAIGINVRAWCYPRVLKRGGRGLRIAEHVCIEGFSPL